MKEFQSRLFLRILVITIVVMLGLGIFLSNLFMKYELTSLTEEIDDELTFLQYLLKQNGGVQSYPLDLDKLNSHLIITDQTGQVIYDNDSKTKNCRTWINKKKTSFISEKRTLVVVKPFYENDVIHGYTIIENSLKSLKHGLITIWVTIIVCFFAALIAIVYFGFRTVATYVKPIEGATNVAVELTKGNYRARTIEKNDKLSQSINKLAKKLLELKVANDIQNDQMEILIENVGSGLLLIDEKGFIMMHNRSLAEIFDFHDQEILFKPYHQINLPSDVVTFIEKIFKSEQKKRMQFTAVSRKDRKNFHLLGEPVISDIGEWIGILLVFHDITEMKNLEEMRKDFVANVSHELRTPITSLKGFAETLLDGAKNDPETLEKFLNIILAESERLQMLIDDLLELSMIEKKSYELQLKNIDLVAILKECCNILQFKIDEKQLDLQIQATSEAITIADEFRIKQVFINIISNAISYTTLNGKIIIQIVPKNSWIDIVIIDDGIGIAKEHIPRIFERFYRVDKARSRENGGTGLGLAIVKHIVEAHRGKLHIVSEVGKGTRFTVSLRKNIL